MRMDKALVCSLLTANSDLCFQAIYITLIPLTSIRLLLIYSGGKEKRIGTIVYLGDTVAEHVPIREPQWRDRERFMGYTELKGLFFF